MTSMILASKALLDVVFNETRSQLGITHPVRAKILSSREVNYLLKVAFYIHSVAF